MVDTQNMLVSSLFNWKTEEIVMLEMLEKEHNILKADFSKD